MAVFDSAFARRLRQREPSAFEALVKGLLPRVRSMALRYFDSPFEQEDAVQEAFAHLYQHLDAIDPLRADTLEGWALTAARRRMLDLVRRRGLEPAPLDAATEQDVAAEPAGPAAVASAELKAILEAFETKLKPGFRALFRAVFVEGQEWDDARRALGLSRLRARYAKAVLLRALGRHGPLLDYLGRSRRP